MFFSEQEFSFDLANCALTAPLHITPKLQHYNLPTRLLDLTSNALVALYFTCRDKEKTEGEVIVIDIPNADVKYFNSDTISILSHVAKLDSDFDLTKLPSDIKDFNANDLIGQLLHNIRLDNPAFRPIINPKHLSRVLAVRAKHDNDRISRQDAAFLIFGMNAQKTKPAQIPNEWIRCGNSELRITFSSKHILLTRQLNRAHILH